MIVLDDKEIMIDTFSKQCTKCAWLIDLTGRRCLAFPEKIPDDVWQNEKKHDKILFGQEEDYIFEKK